MEDLLLAQKKRDEEREEYLQRTEGKSKIRKLTDLRLFLSCEFILANFYDRGIVVGFQERMDRTIQSVFDLSDEDMKIITGKK